MTKAIGLFLIVVTLGYGHALGQRLPEKATPPVPGSDQILQLREMGLQIIGAVVTEDTAALLKFDRPNLRSEDARALADRRSSLSCFLFNPQCVQQGSRTVRQSLTSARELRLAVHMPTKHQASAVYAALIFYDGRRGEISSDKLCDSGLVRETWTFQWTGTGWVSARPMFDNETEGWCN